MSAKKIIHTFIFACLLQFGASAQNETVEFHTFYDSLSFAMGVENGVTLFNSDSKFDLLDRMALVRGFQTNLFGEPVDEQCEKVLQDFLGTTGSEFNTDHLKEGSRCIGSFIAFQFYTQMNDIEYWEDLSPSLVLKGFKLGVYKQHEKFLSDLTKHELITRFGKMVEADVLAQIEGQDKRFWANALKVPEIQEIEETGIYFEVIEQGSGGKPNSKSDIDAHYILTNAKGDTLESSYASGSSLKINLQMVIDGWKQGFPALEKGGKYRLYVP